MDPRKFLFVMWEGGGNVPPQLGLARKLVERGHRVRVLSEPSIEQEVCAIGCEFGPFKKAPHRLDRSPASDFVRDWEPMTPFGAFGRVRDRVLLGPALAYAIDTLNEITCFSPHVLAVDWLLTGAQVAGECAAIPTAALVHAIYMMPAPGKPAPGFGFRPAQGVVGRLRDRTCNRLFLALFDRGMPQLNKARRQMGLPPVASITDQFGRSDRLLVLGSEHFDFRSIQAVAAIRVHALVTLGSALDPVEFAAPAHVFLVRSAPHDRLFADSSVVVTHAGLGTVTRALAHGVPLVCMPMGRDQDDVAARVVEHGAGVRIWRRASAKKIRRQSSRFYTIRGFVWPRGA
jgi:UDP:flavonoid glycosyltransferase YjiC (YdhE family)